MKILLFGHVLKYMFNYQTCIKHNMILSKQAGLKYRACFPLYEVSHGASMRTHESSFLYFLQYRAFRQPEHNRESRVQGKPMSMFSEANINFDIRVCRDIVTAESQNSSIIKDLGSNNKVF
ncbi:hypothetical protein O6H91_Y407900 [Diphasiastrum complanatum]|nr:hypothetical protein O6H91_Y407900 [Diphasiastrum complanatum]